MAFFNRVGSLLKQNVGKHVTSELSASNASLFQAIRCMSSKLFVGGLSYGTDEMSLREAFCQYGEVVEARIIMDRETGRSRGFGFITFTSTEAASSAIQAYDGQELHGRRIRVNFATEKPRGGGFGGGFGGAGGGFGYGDQGGNYGGGGGGYGGGNFGGGGGYGGNSPYGGGGGGGYGGGNNYPSGGGGGFGAADNYPSGGGGFGGDDAVQGGGGNNFTSGNQTGFSSLLNDEPSGTTGESHEAGVGTGNEGTSEYSEEPNDYANNRS